jgi:hypothetical protein
MDLAMLRKDVEPTTNTPLSTIPKSLLLGAKMALPEPLQVLEQYKQWHSVEALRRDPHNRTFALGYYSCPLQAGNRLHHFFNSLLWAVVSNRTLLWKYYDKETCRAVQSDERLDNEVCGVANTLHDCDPVLKRASWLPSYDEFAQELKLPEPLYLNFWTTRPSNIPWHQTRNNPWHDSYTNFTGIDNRTEWPLVSFPIMLGMSGSLNRDDRRRKLLANHWSREMARKLHSLGTPFLFGMLFRESFRMTAMVQQDIPKANHTDTTIHKSFSIALHSRHSNPKAIGADTRNERRCLTQLLDQAPTNSECVVYLMSDRPKTIEMLTAWLSTSKNCTAITAPHQKGTSFRGEHGPWSGIGFYQDLATVSQARNGFIGKTTTSSFLLLEMIEYDRAMEAWRLGEGNSTDPLLRCSLN